MRRRYLTWRSVRTTLAAYLQQRLSHSADLAPIWHLESTAHGFSRLGARQPILVRTLVLGGYVWADFLDLGREALYRERYRSFATPSAEMLAIHSLRSAREKLCIRCVVQFGSSVSPERTSFPASVSKNHPSSLLRLAPSNTHEDREPSRDHDIWGDITPLEPMTSSMSAFGSCECERRASGGFHGVGNREAPPHAAPPMYSQSATRSNLSREAMGRPACFAPRFL